MYSSVRSAVRVDKNNVTDYFNCLSGVRQGCILSPLLFSLYVSEFNDMLNNMMGGNIELCTNDEDKANILMYADDMCLLADSVINMQRKINCLQAYCSKWGLSVNLNKTKMIVFRNGGIMKFNCLRNGCFLKNL